MALENIGTYKNVSLNAVIDPATGNLLDWSTVGGGGGGTATDREIQEVAYNAVNAFTGASVGDVIVAVKVYDVATTPASLLETIWVNTSTNTALLSPPLVADIDPIADNALTDSQLRASAVAVSKELPTGGFTGQVAIDVDSTPKQVSTSSVPLIRGVNITAYVTSGTSITYGYDGTLNDIDNGTGNGSILEDGQSKFIEISNLNQLYINGKAGDFIDFDAS